jgi:hypothetical protein
MIRKLRGEGLGMDTHFVLEAANSVGLASPANTLEDGGPGASADDLFEDAYTCAEFVWASVSIGKEGE